MAGPLAGIRVLDLTRILAGPWATQNLADLGADVVKIERPGGGDDTRRFGPPFVHDATTGDAVHAAYFLAANRNKRSVAIDLAHPEGAALVRRLAADCDVLVENFKVGDLARYGLDYPSLHAALPRLVYCSLTGFGQTGPYAARPGYDYLIQAMGGMMSITGERDDLPGGGPQRAGIAITDILSGMYAALGIVAALRHRDATGEGQHLDIGMLDVQVGILANQAMNYLTSGVVPGRIGNGHPNLAPYRVFATADGHVVVTVGNDDQFRRLCAAIDLPAVPADPRFATNPSRVLHTDALTALLEPVFARRTTDAWVVGLEAAGVSCGPINTIDRVFADPHVQARGMRLDLPHPVCGTVPGIASPMKFSATPVDHDRAPPLLGQHTDEVLGGMLGLDAPERARLAEAGTIARWTRD